MINPDNRVPGIGRMAGITACGAGDVCRRFAGGGRAVVTGITGSRYTRMIKLKDRLPCTGRMAGVTVVFGSDMRCRFSCGSDAVMTA